jgi:hypothetical protein
MSKPVIPLIVETKLEPDGTMFLITICLSAPEEINFILLFYWLALFSSANLMEVMVLEWSSSIETFL